MIQYRQFSGIKGDVVCEVLHIADFTYVEYEKMEIFNLEDEYGALELPLNEYSSDVSNCEFNGLGMDLSRQIATAVRNGAELLHIYKRKVQMINRGLATVMNVQVEEKQMKGFERLSSAGVREGAIYVDIDMYIDREESHETVDEALERFTDMSVFCFFV